MKLSYFGWPQAGRQGWIIGPFFNKCLRIEIPFSHRDNFGFLIALYDFGAKRV